MKPQTAPSSNAFAWIAAVVLILLCGTGIAALMGWIPGLTSGTGNKITTLSHVIQTNA